MASDNAGCTKAISEETGTLGYIYIIESGPYYKIGKTVNPQTRPNEIISSIQRHDPKLPFKPRLVVLLGTWANQLGRIEKAWHQLYSRPPFGKRLQGEWFEIPPEQLIWLLREIEERAENLWIDQIIWKDYAEYLEFPVAVPCPS